MRIDDDIPFEVAAWSAAESRPAGARRCAPGRRRPGETVVILGIGGVGINAVQGAAYAGANVIAIDPNPFKLERPSSWGRPTPSDVEEAARSSSRSRAASWRTCVVTVGVLEPEITADAVSLVGKAGRVVLTSVSRADVNTVSLTGSPLVGWHKRIQGSLAGGANPIYEMPSLLDLYRSGHLKLDEIITRATRWRRSTRATGTCSTARTSAA